jgi:isopenicillin-N epimerase
MAWAGASRTYGASLRHLWPLDPAVSYLNHGGFGVTPHEVLAAQQQWRLRIERNPTRFLVHELPALLREAAAVLAAYVGVRGDDLVFVDNATTGCNAILRSLELGPGDEILLTDLAYGAIVNAAHYTAERTGASVVTVKIPLPLAGTQVIVDRVEAALSRRTRLAIFDHIASHSALVLPVAELSRVAHAAGAWVAIDGAHAPGQIALDLPAIGADWFVGNCHKWLMAPRACGFIWVNPSAPPIHPTTISHGYGRGLSAEFDWTGTRDPSPFLCAPAGIAFHENLGGRVLMERNAALARAAGELLARAWGSYLGGPPEAFAAMVTVRLPLELPPTPELAAALRDRLAEDGIIAEVYAHAGELWMRVAAQAYNELGEYERLAAVLPTYA